MPSRIVMASWAKSISFTRNITHSFDLQASAVGQLRHEFGRAAHQRQTRTHVLDAHDHQSQHARDAEPVSIRPIHQWHGEQHIAVQKDSAFSACVWVKARRDAAWPGDSGMPPRLTRRGSGMLLARKKDVLADPVAHDAGEQPTWLSHACWRPRTVSAPVAVC